MPSLRPLESFSGALWDLFRVPQGDPTPGRPHPDLVSPTRVSVGLSPRRVFGSFFAFFGTVLSGKATRIWFSTLVPAGRRARKIPDVTGRARQPTRKRKGARNWFSKISSDRAAPPKKKLHRPTHPDCAPPGGLRLGRAPPGGQPARFLRRGAGVGRLAHPDLAPLGATRGSLGSAGFLCISAERCRIPQES